MYYPKTSALLLLQYITESMKVIFEVENTYSSGQFIWSGTFSSGTFN